MTALSGWRADMLLEQRSFSSDADGFYEIPRIKPGKTLLKADREGYSTFYRRDLVLQPDQALENYTIMLVKGEPMTINAKSSNRSGA